MSTGIEAPYGAGTPPRLIPTLNILASEANGLLPPLEVLVDVETGTPHIGDPRIMPVSPACPIND
jgi:hypothetical protein